MMALQLLPILQVIVILCTPTALSYPTIYGTKRYGRSASHRVVTPSWSPYQTMYRTQRYPLNYYELYPYSQQYPEDLYYTQDYPVYYPPARTSKYEVYQAVLPYYYQDRPLTRPGYGYYGFETDPMLDIQEEIQEAEREQREDAQPIGHEMLYENEDVGSDEALGDVKAAFLQNLIASQMYKDKEDDYYEPYGYSDYDEMGSYAKWEDIPVETKQQQNPSYYQEDENVKELKQLAEPRKQNKQNKFKQQNQDQYPEENIHWFQKNNYRNQNKHNQQENNKRSLSSNYQLRVNDVQIPKMNALSDRKPIIKQTSSSTVSPVTVHEEEPRRDSRGQKEEVMMRPATPVRRPFSSPVMEMMSKNDKEKKRTPSVYDTIKHMLDMEKSLENKYGVDEIRPHMKKRIISSEESLTQQLSVLKKAQ